MNLETPFSPFVSSLVSPDDESYVARSSHLKFSFRLHSVLIGLLFFRFVKRVIRLFDIPVKSIWLRNDGHHGESEFPRKTDWRYQSCHFLLMPI